MHRKWLTWLLGLAVIVVFAQPAIAQDKKSNLDDQKGTVTPQAKAVAEMTMAARLIQYGREAKSPMALAAAAQILRDTPTQEEKRAKTIEGTATDAKAPNPAGLPTADAIFVEAATMAKAQNDAALAGIIEKQSKVVAQRGRLSGPLEKVENVKVNTSDVYMITFKGKEAARIGVIGDGDADLDLYVYDENGHRIAFDNDNTPVCAVEWTPSWTGPFKVKVVNTGKANSDYILLTN